MSGLLVVAGEASGDRAAARVVARLSGVRAFGMGGGALESVGTDVIADMRAVTALGVGEVATRAASIALAHARVLAAARWRRPRAALLVNYTEFNARLAPRLHRNGVKVLWYVAPQVWAWRPARAASLRPHIDRMAVILPFEEALWRSEGVDARYVGHPSREGTRVDRATARAALGLTPYAPAVAILPGSRPHEVDALLPAMLDGYERVRHDRASLDARLLLASSIAGAVRARAFAAAARARVAVFEVDPHAGASPVLGAFDAALCASGTATLETALARAVPVTMYRTGLATEIVARLLVKAPRLALPNVLLGRTVFTELLQRDVRPSRIAEALGEALERRDELVSACDSVEAVLGPPRQPSREVAEMLEPWL